MDDLTALIVEDDLSFALNLEIYLKEFGFHRVFHKTDVSSAVEFVDEKRPNLALVDIHLPGKLSGLELAKFLQSKEIPIIFFTGDEQDALYEQAKAFSPVAYMIKPVHRLSLRSTLEHSFFPKHEKEHNTEDKAIPGDGIRENIFYIKQNRNLYKVKIDEIFWIQADGNYCNIYTCDRKFVIKLSLRRILDQLPDDQFIRVHRSAIVRKNAIQQIDLNDRYLQVKKYQVPLGPKYREEVVKLFSNT